MFRLLPLLSLAVLSAGCRHHCRRGCDDNRLGDRLRDRIEDRQDGRRRDPGIDSDRAIPPGVIPPRTETIPATPLPVTPSRSNFVETEPHIELIPPERSARKVPLDLPPSSVPSDPVLTVPTPNRTLLLPDPLLQEPTPRSAPPKVDTPLGIFGDPIIPGDAVESPKPAPTGIDSFAQVPGQDKVAGGRKPSLEGLEALKTQGYKTVLYLHAPDADLTAARETVEKRGLTFAAIAVSPQTLADASKAFAAQLKDAAAKPLFVYDLDGIRAGSLWYIQFRTADLLGDEAARIRAGSLGLQDPEKSEEQQRFWIAIQDMLAKR